MTGARVNWGTKVVFVALCAGGLSTCTAIKNAVEPSQPGAFYTPPTPLPAGPPGTILRSEPVKHPPTGALAYKILYKSLNIHGGEVAVSAIVIVPNSPAPPEGRPVVAWAHPTTGIARRCAPSIRPDPFRSIEGTDLFIKNNIVVVATDYEGLGTPGPHPFLVGVSEGQNVLDLVRAVAGNDDWHARKEFVVWGHSQGGQAAFFTGPLRATYAPELDLAGIAAAAPATNLRALFDADKSKLSGKGLLLYAIDSWSQIYDVPTTSILTPNSTKVMKVIADDCIESTDQFIFFGLDLEKLDGPVTTGDPAKTEPWKGLLEKNSTGVKGIDVPVFIAQGTKDNVVVPDVTKAYAKRLCEAGVTVELKMYEGIGHVPMGKDAAPAVSDWVNDRFAGKPAPSTCETKTTTPGTGATSRSDVR
jgi:pimeloyl-ACP methyl ester carboxylesterase